MLKKESISTRTFVENNKELFEEVAKGYINAEKPDTKYSILNYEIIISKMIEFIEGYIAYKAKGDTKFDGKVLGTTLKFYNQMFTDREYRTEITLHDMPELNKTFLAKTKDLQTIIEKHADDDKDYELRQLLIMTDNQYRKLSHVYRDDMEIYLWLATSGSKVYQHNIPAKLRSHFNDKTTPVMHAVKSKND